MELASFFRIGIKSRADVSVYTPARLVLGYTRFVHRFGVDILEECLSLKDISQSINRTLWIALLWHAWGLDPGLGKAPNRQSGLDLVYYRDKLHADHLKTDFLSIKTKRLELESAVFFA